MTGFQFPLVGIPEQDRGNIEYKLLLRDTNPERLDELATQMKFRLFEGGGEAIYIIGIRDDGYPEGISEEEMTISLETLQSIARKINAYTEILRSHEDSETKLKITELLVRKHKDPEKLPMDIPVVTLGNVDSGKSTLLGVLQTGNLDDGRGSARISIFRYKHELESGRTSSISQVTIGFKVDGKIVSQDKIHVPTDMEILEESIKTISFYDLAGHEKYLKTTIYGLSTINPKFALLIVAANQGVLPMTKEHLGLAVSLRIPLIIVITKEDMTPPQKYEETLNSVKKILRIPGVSRIPLLIYNENDLYLGINHLPKGDIVPIISVSSVKGTNINLLTKFLNLLPITKTQKDKQALEFGAYITEIFFVTGVGTVVSVQIYSGSLRVQDFVHLGPFEGGIFKKVRVKSIHYKRVPTKEVFSGQTATFALHQVKREEVRKGMVLLGMNMNLGASNGFVGEIYILYHSTTIKQGYAPVVHTQSIQQSAKIVKMNKSVLRTGDRAKVTFEFMYRPEFISIGQKFLIREGKTKGIGQIIKLIP